MPRRKPLRGDNPAARNIEDIARLERDASHEMSLGERVSLAVTDAVGTGWCAALHISAMALWIAWNTRLAPAAWRVDPYPFGLLTMWVSMEGVLLAITQNRMSRQTDRRDHLDLQVNLLSEQEMTMVLRLLSRIAERLDVKADGAEQDEAQQLMQQTNIYELMDELRRKFR